MNRQIEALVSIAGDRLVSKFKTQTWDAGQIAFEVWQTNEITKANARDVKKAIEQLCKRMIPS